jgi:hypothetical protein
MNERTEAAVTASAMDSRKAQARARQYVLMSGSKPVYPTWDRVTFGANLVLHHDPRLHVAVRSGAALVGSFYDLALGTMDAEAILADVVRAMSDEERLYDRLSFLAGRWTFFWRSSDEVKIVSGAAGLLPVFYLDSSDAPIVSCNPELIAELAGAPISADGERRMAEPSYRTDQPTEMAAAEERGADNWWPGELTPYRSVRHLLPNHCLELYSRRIERFWPMRPLRRQSAKAAAAQAGQMLSAILEGVSRDRRKVLMPVTAGLDSRALLALSRSAAQRYACFVYAPAKHKTRDLYVEDRVVAGNLARRQGLRLTELRYAKKLDDEFADRLAANMSFITASHTIGFEAQAITRAFGTDVTLLNGNVSEIARNYFGFMPRSLVDERYLTCAIDLELSPLTRAELARWLPEARKACARGRIELSDLFYWEFRMGCWQAYVQVQLGGMLDIFTPYNCRKLIETLLSAPKGARSGVVAPLYREMIAQSWPELLDVPINPSKSRSYRVRAGAFIRRHPLLNFAAKASWYGYKQRRRGKRARASA